MASRGRRGEDTASSVALTGRLDKVLQRLEEESRAELRPQRQNCGANIQFSTTQKLHSRRGEVGIIGAPWRAEALHALSRLGLDLLLGLGPSVVMVDVVVVDVLCGLPACHQNLGSPRIRTKEGPVANGHHCTRPIWGA